jgi:MinD superfamily P-loop ATPase
MKELAIISGKGGTGKTSVVASLAALCKNAVLADCDVDAADLHLVLAPKVLQEEPFSGGKLASVIAGACTGCGKCEDVCRFDAVRRDGPANDLVAETFRIDQAACEGCGVCHWFCDDNAIEFQPALNGKLFVSETRYGPMVHAQLGVGEENSGKLVTRVRTVARELAEKECRDLLILDGSPGIGCPVIASVTGVDLVVVVTEPTQSGLHDLERVAKLTAFFEIPTVVCINKWDINPEITEEIQTQAREMNVPVVGKIRYDRAVTAAQLMQSCVVEYTGGKVAREIETLWRNITYELG